MEFEPHARFRGFTEVRGKKIWKSLFEKLTKTYKERRLFSTKKTQYEN